MEPSAAIDTAKHVLLAFGVILAGGTLAGVLAWRLALPDVVAYLLAGILLGPRALGLIEIKADSALNQVILFFGASYILFDGGASIRFAILKRVWITIVLLATIGVVITGTITAAAAYWILGVPVIVAALLGAVIASTDPATLVPVFRQVKVRERVAQAVMSESALNDATGAIATFAVLAVASGAGFSFTGSLADLGWQALLGFLIGGTLGYLAALFTAPWAPVVTLVAVIGAYLGADHVHASGFMAVFALGVIFGNRDAFGFKVDAQEQQRLDDFVATVALVMRMFIFMLLGAQVDFALMGRYALGGALVVVVFMLAARPLTVFLCAAPDRRAKWTLGELLFMCWTRETGVIPAALAGLLLGMKAPGAELVASVTFIAVLMTILIQATTTRWLAKRLGLLLP